MTSSHPERVVIITHDLKLNRTFTERYFSFIVALKGKGHFVKGVGIDFAFKPHPINNLDKNKERSAYENDIITISTNRLNFIQKLLKKCDSYNLPFFLKKGLLALHVIIYKTDQWLINIDDFKCLEDFKPSIVISGGSGGIIKSAYRIAKKYNAKFFIDYRDPMNFGYHLLETNRIATIIKQKFTIETELEMLREADQIITVSESLKSFFPEPFKSKITIIENGCNFEERDIINQLAHPKSFAIIYLGTLYNVQLEDLNFFSAIHDFLYANQLKSSDFRISFLGSSQNMKLVSIIKKFGLENYVEITDRVTKAELKLRLANASMFLHLKYGDRSQIISSKQADYLMFRKPILLPNTDNGDLAESILANKAGYVLNGEVNSITEVLEKEYDKFLNGESAMLEERDMSALSRSKIAEKLLKLIP